MSHFSVYVIAKDESKLEELLAPYSENIEVEVALQFVNEFHENVMGFCNNIYTLEGGTHITGFKTAFTTIINNYARELGILKDKDVNFTGTDEEVNRIMITLMQAGVMVGGYHREESNLETLFMQLTGVNPMQLQNNMAPQEMPEAPMGMPNTMMQQPAGMPNNGNMQQGGAGWNA